MAPFFNQSFKLTQKLRTMKKLLVIALLIPLLSFGTKGDKDGLGIPTKKWFIGFGNSPIFTGLRFNFKDRDVEKINGVSFTMWMPKEDNGEGTVNGLSVGLPFAGGTAYRNGLNLGLFGMSANENLNGINISGVGAGAGNNLNGLNIAGIGLGSGENLNGVSLAGIGLGSGDDLKGLSFAGIGIGAGDNLTGISFAGIGVGAGGDMKGINIGGIGVGAGGTMTGLNIGGVGTGAGGIMKGVNVGGIGVGSGEILIGLNIAGVGVGAPEVKGISIASVVGGNRVVGLAIAPAMFKIGDKDIDEEDVELKGVSISAFNNIQGENNGLSIGIFNIAKGGKGFQIGLLNHNPNNPKGLRWLPFFNANFNKK